MKKNMIRILALALVLILALGIIPLGALAAAIDVSVSSEYYLNTTHPTIKDYFTPGSYNWYRDYPPKSGTDSVTIKTSDYDKYVVINGETYDLKGIIDQANTDWTNDNNLFAYTNQLIVNDKYLNEYGNLVLMSYVPHQHKLSRWYSDGTTHWRECLVCKQLNPSHDIFFIGQNWCQDGDEDQVCNVCGGHVPYHDITVIDSEGGKITLNRDNASHRMKITADVETNDGYQFVKLHFTKVRPDGSKQEVVRYGSGKSFWTNMPTYPMEVTAEFVKK